VNKTKISRTYSLETFCILRRYLLPGVHSNYPTGSFTIGKKR